MGDDEDRPRPCSRCGFDLNYYGERLRPEWEVPPCCWPRVGVKVARDPSGRIFPTHALGDDHALSIVLGEIDYDEAVDEERSVDRQKDVEIRREIARRNLGRWT